MNGHIRNHCWVRGYLWDMLISPWHGIHDVYLDNSHIISGLDRCPSHCLEAWSDSFNAHLGAPAPWKETWDVWTERHDHSCCLLCLAGYRRSHHAKRPRPDIDISKSPPSQFESALGRLHWYKSDDWRWWAFSTDSKTLEQKRNRLGWTLAQRVKDQSEICLSEGKQSAYRLVLFKLFCSAALKLMIDPGLQFHPLNST